MIYLVARVITFQSYMHWMLQSLTATVLALLFGFVPVGQSYPSDKRLAPMDPVKMYMIVYIDLGTTCAMLLSVILRVFII